MFKRFGHSSNSIVVIGKRKKRRLESLEILTTSAKTTWCVPQKIETRTDSATMFTTKVVRFTATQASNLEPRLPFRSGKTSSSKRLSRILDGSILARKENLGQSNTMSTSCSCLCPLEDRKFNSFTIRVRNIHRGMDLCYLHVYCIHGMLKSTS